LVGDSEEIRTLVTPNWEHAARGLMFDIENHSKFPVVITSFDAQAGRGKGPDASAAYSIYHAVGKWNVQRCPVCRIFPFKFMKCCCGSCPSGRADFGCMKRCCRCTPCGKGRAGCCCYGECGLGVEIAEPCCEACIPCFTGNFAIPIFVIPAIFPFCCWGLGCCVGKHHGGLGAPGCPAISLGRLCGCKCCRNGVHRHTNDCTLIDTPIGPLCSANCSCCSTFCHCCRKKFYDRRRWTHVSGGFLNLPSDWGEYGALPSMQHYGAWKERRDGSWVKSGGGILIPPKQTAAVYIHCAHPTSNNGKQGIAIRGPFKRGYERGDVTDKDAFIRLRTGAMTLHPVPFANSDLTDSSRDGQFYSLQDQQIDEYKLCAFAGKVHYRVLDPQSTPTDCAWLCGSRLGCQFCC